MKTLYLHIGWSKTGTSAIQYQLDLQHDSLKSSQILYSRKLQMNDQAHHHFALAFSPVHGYPAKYNVQQALDILDTEMDEEDCDNALISSELSPFYFNNPKFLTWVNRFDQVKVIATLRRQSDLLLSLFNQLVKDPQVRYSGRFFQMAINNFPKMNFYQNLLKWENKVGRENILIVNYDDGVVDTFLEYFGLGISEENNKLIVNPSLPTKALILMQERGRKAVDAAQYTRIRNNLLQEIDGYDENLPPERVLLTKGELRALDNFFKPSNKNVAKTYLGANQLFKDKVYNDILCY